ncbi:MAG: hypothetical protein KTR31_31535 [Myxococcales bacterium]|nr:hypothetical protein [Myxococcales bacterium]
MEDPRGRFLCERCERRYREGGGDCPHCDEEPLLDLADDDVLEMLAEYDWKREQSWMGTMLVVGGVPGMFVAVVLMFLMDVPQRQAKWVALLLVGAVVGTARLVAPPKKKSPRSPKRRIRPWHLVLVSTPLIVLLTVALAWVASAMSPAPPEWSGQPPEAPPQAPVAVHWPGIEDELPASMVGAEADALMAAAWVAHDAGEETLAATLASYAVAQDETVCSLYDLSRLTAADFRIDTATYWLQRAALEEGVEAALAHQDADLLSLRLMWRWRKLSPFLVEAEQYRAARVH